MRTHALASSSIPSSADAAAVAVAYFSCIRRRDLDGLLSVLSEAGAGQFRAWRNSREFSAFFELWCAEQGTLAELIRCHVAGDGAVVEARVGADLVRLLLRHDGERWAIESEARVAPRSAHPQVRAAPRRP